jgi:predicted nucleic acid-binding protein
MMTLVDSSAWIGHFRTADPKIITLLERKEILIHSAVLGELAAGHIKNRARILGDLKLIPRAIEVDPIEVLDFIEMRSLFGKGLSWVDIQLLASCLATQCHLLTLDIRLKKMTTLLSFIPL